jgi:hypothetical protein
MHWGAEQKNHPKKGWFDFTLVGQFVERNSPTSKSFTERLAI